MTLYQKLIERKRTWTPVQMEAGKLKEGSEEMIFRALALRHLEIPVGEFISAGLKGEVPEESQELLKLNIIDEENHDKALGFAARALGTDEAAEKEAELGTADDVESENREQELPPQEGDEEIHETSSDTRDGDTGNDAPDSESMREKELEHPVPAQQVGLSKEKVSETFAEKSERLTGDISDQEKKI